MGRLVSVQPTVDFRERRCCTLMRGMIGVKLRSPFTIMVTNFTNNPVFLQNHIRWEYLSTPELVLVTFRICPYPQRKKPETWQR